MANMLSAVGVPLDAPTFMNAEKKPLLYLIPYDKDGIPLDDLKKSFQFWPMEISETGDPNYSSRNIPGGSLPFYQWINNTDNTISFQSQFIRDLDGIIGEQVEEDQYNVDVEAAISWLKMLKMPHYRQGDLHVEPPYTLKLVTPGMNMWYGKQYANVILTQCSVNYRDWIPDLSNESNKAILMHATADLTFSQVIQGLKTMKFPGRDTYEEMASKYTFGG